MRVLVVGDVHGEFELLAAWTAAVGPRSPPPLGRCPQHHDHPRVAGTLPPAEAVRILTASGTAAP